VHSSSTARPLVDHTTSSAIASRRARERRDLVASLGLLGWSLACSLALVSDEPAIDPEFTKLVAFMEEHIPFNKLLGIRVELLRRGECVLRIPWMDGLIGDASRPAVHGGVISTLADTAGGAACFSLLSNPEDRVSTVDLRVDYLRPGPSMDLLCYAKTIRMGNKVAVARMEVFAGALPDARVSQFDTGEAIATAQAVYNVVRRES
jgi:uncharacterized protein (TIGR00369 family)